jgi:TPR repeat protein
MIYPESQMKFILVLVVTLIVFSSQVRADPQNQLQSGKEAFDRQKWPTALKLLQPLADEGNVQAQNLLGRMYWAGLGVPIDRAKAVQWWKQSADQGNPEGQWVINGVGVN